MPDNKLITPFTSGTVPRRRPVIPMIPSMVTVPLSAQWRIQDARKKYISPESSEIKQCIFSSLAQ